MSNVECGELCRVECAVGIEYEVCRLGSPVTSRLKTVQSIACRLQSAGRGL